MIEISDKSLTGYTFIDLFAGVGGFRLGLESLGAKCIFSSEIDSDAKKIYQKNYGDLPEGDITKIMTSEIPKHNILCGGFPCQAFSISGNRNGFEDSRGTLFFEIARIVRDIKPEVVFMENVKNFLTHDKGNTFLTVKNIMEDLGYEFNYQILNAADYGVPQFRERLFMVCFRKDLKNIDFKFPEKIELKKHVEDILLPDSETEFLYRSEIPVKLYGVEEKYTNKCLRVGDANNITQGYRIYSTKGSAITLSAYGGGCYAKTGGYLINGRVRKLHPRECARLNGFPDSFELDPVATHSYQQMGNSVVVDVIQRIGIEIGKTLKGETYSNALF